MTTEIEENQSGLLKPTLKNDTGEVILILVGGGKLLGLSSRVIITVDETSSHGTQNRSPSDEPAGLTIERLSGPRRGPGREH